MNPSEKYLDMARISIVTITYTVFLALMYLISKGWNLILFQLTRNQATYLTMIMGAVYLAYSAFFLSNDFVGVRKFMIVIILRGLSLTLHIVNPCGALPGVSCYELEKSQAMFRSFKAHACASPSVKQRYHDAGFKAEIQHLSVSNYGLCSSD